MTMTWLHWHASRWASLERGFVIQNLLTRKRMLPTIGCNPDFLWGTHISIISRPLVLRFSGPLSKEILSNSQVDPISLSLWSPWAMFPKEITALYSCILLYIISFCFQLLLYIIYTMDPSKRDPKQKACSRVRSYSGTDIIGPRHDIHLTTESPLVLILKWKTVISRIWITKLLKTIKDKIRNK